MQKTQQNDTRLVVSLVSIALVVAAIGSLGAPLITVVAQSYHVSLSISQWTLTITLLSGAVFTPLLGRIGSAYRRRKVILATLIIVSLGSIATTIPAPFVILLVGRTAQGMGLGLTALMMATARQYLGTRAASTIALLSVASTVGIGIGYPISGILVQYGNVHIAYLFGTIVALAALITAIIAIPHDISTPQRHEPVDWLGVILLSVSLITILLAASQSQWWSNRPLIAILMLLGGCVALIIWVIVERKVPYPLIDLYALRNPAVAGANLLMFIAGISMYLLFTLITRFVQTPLEIGYGYGLNEIEAGLVLVPFSALGFIAGRIMPKMGQKMSPLNLLIAHGIMVCLACILFAITRGMGVFWPIAVMGILGFGVGGFSAVMPQAILGVTPAEETAAAMSINQVVRSVGFTLGSAIDGLILAAYTAPQHFAPSNAGYSTAAWIAGILALVTMGLAARMSYSQIKQSSV